MNEKLIEKIVEIYNRWQDKYLMEYQKRVPMTYLPKIIIYEDGRCDTEFEISSEGFELHGFLINRNYGLFEALYKERYGDVEGDGDMSKESEVDGWLYDFALASNKDAWLEENI